MRRETLTPSLLGPIVQSLLQVYMGRYGYVHNVQRSSASAGKSAHFEILGMQSSGTATTTTMKTRSRSQREKGNKHWISGLGMFANVSMFAQTDVIAAFIHQIEEACRRLYNKGTPSTRHAFMQTLPPLFAASISPASLWQGLSY